MPIYLPAPGYTPGGPDGQGWNRISLGSLAGDECALQPHSWATLRESRDTRLARYGGFGLCTRRGACDSCEVLTRRPRTLNTPHDVVLVRLQRRDGPGDQPYVMAALDPAAGWAGPAEPWSWADLSRVPDWDLADRHWDEHGEAFWLVRYGAADAVGTLSWRETQTGETVRRYQATRGWWCSACHSDLAPNAKRAGWHRCPTQQRRTSAAPTMPTPTRPSGAAATRATGPQTPPHQRARDHR